MRLGQRQPLRAAAPLTHRHLSSPGHSRCMVRTNALKKTNAWEGLMACICWGMGERVREQRAITDGSEALRLTVTRAPCVCNTLRTMFASCCASCCCTGTLSDIHMQ